MEGKGKALDGKITKYPAGASEIRTYDLWVTRRTTASYGEIKQKVITQANDYHRVKAYTP